MMIMSSEPIEQLPLSDLEQACRKETQNYRRSLASDTRFCQEIFRRALGQLVEGVPQYMDEEARTILVRTYTPFIEANINRAAVRSLPFDDLVQQVWLRFWRAANRGLSFPTLEAALNYLKQTTVSTLIEAQRQQRKRDRDDSLQQVVGALGEESLNDTTADLFNQHSQQRFRERCREVLVDPLEYQVFWMRYGMALPPREIARILDRQGCRIKEQAPSARAVSDILERSCRRLRLDQEIYDLLRFD